MAKVTLITNAPTDGAGWVIFIPPVKRIGSGGGWVVDPPKKETGSKREPTQDPVPALDQEVSLTEGKS